jgi:hypothetical protein
VGIKAATAGFPLLVPGGVDEVLLWAFSSDHWISVILFFGPLLLGFLLVMFLFVPLGQAVGIEMAQHRPLPAYAVNVIASLVGVWAFAATSAVQAPPALWFGLASLGMIGYARLRGIFSWSFGGLQIAVLVGLALTQGGSIWSPYQKLVVEPVFVQRRSDGQPMPAGHQLDTQVGFHQHAYNLSPEFLSTVEPGSPNLAELAHTYDLPYTFIEEGADVLIVGAGMGNDVAAALRAGVGQVDAVEIDPRIQSLGLALHPERPYDDPRVNAVVDDARSFIQRTDKRWRDRLPDCSIRTLLSGIAGCGWIPTWPHRRGLLHSSPTSRRGGVSVTFLTVEPGSRSGWGGSCKGNSARTGSRCTGACWGRHTSPDPSRRRWLRAPGWPPGSRTRC